MMGYQEIVRARVYLRDRVVGELEKRSSQSVVFAYADAYLSGKAPIPIAHCFPLQREPFEAKGLHPYFDNMILEGWLLERGQRELHVDKKNRFALLMAVGRAPIGAVAVRALDEHGEEIFFPQRENAGDEEVVDIAENQVLQEKGLCPACLNPSPKSSLYHRACQKALWGPTGRLRIRLDKEEPLNTFSQTIYGGGISGAQRKGLFAFDAKKKILNANVDEAVYILKPDGEFPELPANEHLTMAIAKKSGFSTPPFGIVEVPKLGLVYVIKRFDRIGGRKRLVEDMAQILGELTKDKYSGSYEKVAGAIRGCAEAPKLDLNEFFRRLVFCFLTANGDMHLKNWMLLESEELDGNYALSPCYDLLNTRVAIPKEPTDTALSLMGRQSKITWIHLEEFAVKRLALAQKFVESVRYEIEHWSDAIDELIPNSLLSEPFKKRYSESVQSRKKLLNV